MQAETVQMESAGADRLLHIYNAAVEEWIAAIRREEALASQNHSLVEVDEWEQAHFNEEEARYKAKAAKKGYESALREKFFHFH
jgi:hypothetical protein